MQALLRLGRQIRLGRLFLGQKLEGHLPQLLFLVERKVEVLPQPCVDGEFRVDGKLHAEVEPGVEPDRLGVIGVGLDQVALLPVDPRRGVAHIGVFGVDAKTLGEVGDGLVELPAGRVGSTPDFIGEGAVRRQSDGLGILDHGLVIVAHFPVGSGTQKVGIGSFRIRSEGRGGGGKRPFELALRNAVTNAMEAKLGQQAGGVQGLNHAMETERIGRVFDLPITAAGEIGVVEAKCLRNKHSRAEAPRDIDHDRQAVRQSHEAGVVADARPGTAGDGRHVQSPDGQPDRIAEHEVQQGEALATGPLVADRVGQLMAFVQIVNGQDHGLDQAGEGFGNFALDGREPPPRQSALFVLRAGVGQLLPERSEVPIADQPHDVPCDVFAILQAFDLPHDPLLQLLHGRLRRASGGRKMQLAEQRRKTKPAAMFEVLMGRGFVALLFVDLAAGTVGAGAFRGQSDGLVGIGERLQTGPCRRRRGLDRSMPRHPAA